MTAHRGPVQRRWPKVAAVAAPASTRPGVVSAGLLVLPWAIAGLRGRLGPRGASRTWQLTGVVAGLVAAAGQPLSLHLRAARGRR